MPAASPNLSPTLQRLLTTNEAPAGPEEAALKVMRVEHQTRAAALTTRITALQKQTDTLIEEYEQVQTAICMGTLDTLLAPVRQLPAEMLMRKSDCVDGEHYDTAESVTVSRRTQR